MKQCNSCHGRGGMVVNEDYSLDFEVCMGCDGYGYIYGEDNDDSVPKVRNNSQDRRRG